MNKTIRIATLILIATALLSGCASSVYHDYIMSGQVVTVKDDNTLVICVANTESLEKGDVFNVYRTVMDKLVINEGESGYSREFVGKVKLGEKKDKHFATASVVTGQIYQHDMVEFDK
ncbi:hypothetical protein [Glaciecola sp. 1036]|uniref:hypothetical protein n=1 Tax=Alteromonadaceae TaxID=72275 RepID=UPI003CFCF557